jgi:ATP-dependent exoDNAse (exonuclease V) alpha subunit
MGFKGLERPVVVLAVDGFREGVARDVLYTGLSRARDQLVVVGDLEEIRAAAGNEVCKRLTAAT